MISIFSRTGGKFRKRKQLVQILLSQPFHIYVEPFLGGGQVLLELLQHHFDPQKQYVGADTEPFIFHIWNDLQVVDVNKMEQQFWQGNENLFKNMKQQTSFVVPEDRLYRNLYLSWHSFNQNRIHFKKRTTRKHLWKKLVPLQHALQHAIFLEKDYKVVIQEQDSPTTMFFLDPPYFQKEKYYEYKSVCPYELATLLKNIKGKFLLTYNDVPEVRDAFDCFCIQPMDYYYTISLQNTCLQELLISNFSLNQ